MKTTIYYFTGTGNSLKVARVLSEKLEECELIPIAKIWQKEHLAATREKVGFIFPLHYYGLPKIIFDFIQKIDLEKTTYNFAVITRAGDIDGISLQQIEGILKTKSKILNSGFFVQMPNNYIIYGYDVNSETTQKNMIRNSIKTIEEIVEVVKNNGTNLKTELSEDDRKYGRWNKSFHEKVNESDKFFYVDENCNNCGICETVCPVNNIVLIEGTPQWQHKCQQCLACMNFCPEKSIQFEDKDFAMKNPSSKKTFDVNRYVHPEITVQDIKNQKK